MSRANTIQTNFTSGEVSPYMAGRVDVAKYFNGVRTLRNMIVAPQGGVFRRPGTLFIAETKTSSKKAVLRTFKFSAVQPYVLEFGDQYVRFYYAGAQVTSGTPAVPVEVTTPYLEADVAELKFTQSADVLYITHNSYAPMTLSRVSHTSWVLSEFESIDGPYLSTPGTQKITATVRQDVATATSTSAIFTVTALKTVTNAFTLGTWIRLTSVAHGFTTGNVVTVAGIVGIPEANGTWVIEKIDNDTIMLNNSFLISGHTYVSGGTIQLAPVTDTYVPYREKNQHKLAKVLQVQSTTVALVDVTDIVLQIDPAILVSIGGTGGGYITIVAEAPSFANTDIGKLIRSSVGVWYKIVAFVTSTNVTCTTITTVSYTYPITKVTVSDRLITGLVTADATAFVAGDVGRLIRLQFFEEWVPGKVVGVISSTSAVVELDDSLPLSLLSVPNIANDGIATEWRFGAWSATSGYPAVCTFHQQRLVFGNTTTEPMNLWLSESGDYVGFVPSDPKDSSVTDAHAITVTLVADQVNSIKWLSSGTTLLAGTEGAEWQIKPSSITQVLTPTNISAAIQTQYGSPDIGASARVGSQVLFVQRAGMKLRELQYDFQIDAFVAKDISIISEHIPRLRNGLIEIGVQTVPFSILWAVAGDGSLVGITYEKEHDVIGWHVHELGGSGDVESLAVIESPGSYSDAVYLLVKRTIDGTTKRYIEVIAPFPRPTSYSDVASGYFVDCGISYNAGTPTSLTSLTGLSHLTTSSVAVTVDGLYVGQHTVVAGAVSPGYLGTKFTAGFLYDSIVGILEPEGGSPAGSSQGKKKRINEVTVRMEDSYYFKQAVGTVETDSRMAFTRSMEPTVYDRRLVVPVFVRNAPSTVAPYNVPTVETVRLLSGDLEFAPDSSYTDGAQFDLVQDEPYPFNLLSLMLKLNTNE